MSFGFGGNNNTSSGFAGGFGSTNSGFGSNNNNNNNANSGSLFGGGNSTANTTSGGFGGGGFGSSNATSAFGAKPATGGFGTAATTSGGGMFGSNTSTSGFGGGGFGGTNNASTGFGGTNTGGSMFGGSKPAATGFGGSNTGASMFGGGNTTGGGFGSNTTNTSNPFGGNTANAGFGGTNTNTSTGFGAFGGSNAAASTNGTGGTPFNALTEKDGGSSQMSHFQTITAQQPYVTKSFEELRVEDYAQGRRYGNSNGQAGSFGASTGFGGTTFGGNNANTNTGSTSLFGGNTNNTNNTGGSGFGSGFGSNANTNNTGASSFGGSAASNLFGQKPAGGGLFATPSTGATAGGFGGTSGTTSSLFGGGGGGFGTNNNQQANTGAGIFGNANQTQARPSFGGFASTNANTGGFGGNTNTGGSMFGNTNQNSNTGGLFGSNNNQQAPQGNPFGASTNTGSSLFGGNNQNKPAASGLFGNSTNTGAGGLFGGGNNNPTQQQPAGGLFGGNTANNNAGTSLFGNDQNKPASGGLFGGNTTNTNQGGGLFGNSNNQQQQPANSSLFGGNANSSSSLFGGNNQNKPAGASLFGGGTNTTNTNGGLFGGLGQNNQSGQQSTGGGLFGSLGQSNQSQQNSGSMFGSVGPGQGPQQANQLHASLTAAPYGNEQLFSTLAQSSTPVGPLATPLSGAKPAQAKTPSLLSSTRLNSPIYTPRASTLNRTGTYGLSFSNYGTPGSAYSSSLTPQQSSLLKPTGSLGSALTSRLAKSMSMNNLRPDGTPQSESLLRPTPGSASSKYLKSGSMRKLIIDRSIREDLFAPRPEQQKQTEPSRGGAEPESSGLSKKVSFENSAAKSTAEPNANNALVRTEEGDEEDPPMSSRRYRAQKPDASEMERPHGNSLKTVHEGDQQQRPGLAQTGKKSADAISTNVVVGDYWTKPAIKDLKNMSRTQLSKLGKFVVGREGVGQIEFGPCDLTSTILDNICGTICIFGLRSVTVYPDAATKPPMGKGLNVPATVTMENSWPRSHNGRRSVQARSGPAFERHLCRLHDMANTTFKDFNPDTGIWIFTVEHFTTYGLEEDEEYTEDMDIHQESSGLSELPEDDTMQSVGTGTGDVDDTFEFKNLKTRSQSSLAGRQLPGGFDEHFESYRSDGLSAEEDAENVQMMSGALGEYEDDPFASPGGAVKAPSPGAVERYHSSMVLDDEISAVDIAEETQADHEPPLPGAFSTEEPLKGLRSILKPTAAYSMFVSPEKLAADSWEEQLQRTMSPKKRDRQVLKELHHGVLRQQHGAVIASPLKRSMMGQSVLGQSYLAQKSAKKATFSGNGMGLEKSELGKSEAFRTSMDIMNSLWASEKTTSKAPSAARGFENPYPKKPRLSASAELDEQDAAYHDSMRPSFANNGMLVYSARGSAPQVGQPLATGLRPLVSEHKEVRFARWMKPADLNSDTLSAQKESTAISLVDGFPIAHTDVPTTVFLSIASRTNSESGPERALWELADILFDTVITACGDLIVDMPPEEIHRHEAQLRKDAFANFWAAMLEPRIQSQLAYAKSAEEKALVHLTRNDINAACEVLAGARDFKLATMVAQLPGSKHSRKCMQTQIESWCDRNDWSDMSEPVRALYSIIAGEVCTVQGKNGPTENRVSEFCISEQFNLNWTQSYTLRVFFGGYDNLEDATEAYIKDLADGREMVHPVPWWAEGADTGDKREDTLLGLLRLKISKADLEALFNPKTVSGSSANSRLSWQLATFLRAKGHAISLSDEKLDQLTVGFAEELETANSFVTAAWVLLHITEAGPREKAISGLLFRNASHIDDPRKADSEIQGNWEHLTDILQVPEGLLWAAKAQYASAELRNPCVQTKYLLNAHAAEEAHRVLCTVIGPRAVIEEDVDTLLETLAGFDNAQRIDGWERGGQVFADFAALETLSTGRKYAQEGHELMNRLQIGLQAMEHAESNPSLEVKVAVVEMRRVLKETIREYNASGSGFEAHGAEGGMEGVERSLGMGVDAFMRYREAMGVVA